MDLRRARGLVMAVGVWEALAVARAGAAPRAGDAERASLPGGAFVPLYGLDARIKQTSLPVKPFMLDRFAVREREFFGFVTAHPAWLPGKVARVLADAKYLAHWKNGRPPVAQLEAPVVGVSWFAAEAFCRARGGRLPTTLEWEYAAAAGPAQADARRDPAFREAILRWYASPSSAPPGPVGRGRANFYGVSDMHGLVWEWTADFNGVFVSGDSRQGTDKNKNGMCGGAALGAADREDYAAFMRYAFRSSLAADYALPNLGFRCAYDQP